MWLSRLRNHRAGLCVVTRIQSERIELEPVRRAGVLLVLKSVGGVVEVAEGLSFGSAFLVSGATKK